MCFMVLSFAAICFALIYGYYLPNVALSAVALEGLRYWEKVLAVNRRNLSLLPLYIRLLPNIAEKSGKMQVVVGKLRAISRNFVKK